MNIFPALASTTASFGLIGTPDTKRAGKRAGEPAASRGEKILERRKMPKDRVKRAILNREGVTATIVATGGTGETAGIDMIEAIEGTDTIGATEETEATVTEIEAIEESERGKEAKEKERETSVEIDTTEEIAMIEETEAIAETATTEGETGEIGEETGEVIGRIGERETAEIIGKGQKTEKGLSAETENSLQNKQRWT